MSTAEASVWIVFLSRARPIAVQSRLFVSTQFEFSLRGDKTRNGVAQRISWQSEASVPNASDRSFFPYGQLDGSGEDSSKDVAASSTTSGDLEGANGGPKEWGS